MADVPVSETARSGGMEYELLQTYARGDESAFEQIVSQHGARLYGFLTRFLAHATDAEDVYQAVWLKVARGASRFDGRARFATWLYTIARNAALDHLRAAGRRLQASSLDQVRDVGDTPLRDDIPGAEAAPDESAIAGELGARIRAAVESLPQEQREVFLLKEDGGLSFDEIAAMLSENRETIKSRMRYALGKLRRSLATEARAYGLQEEA